ncbi:MAG: class II fructose-bisphosphate aldolase [Oscillospiraceae bacterium]|nr:class II fructose-bisphosphate aldolase [Oscillospiraceae bacterium]
MSLVTTHQMLTDARENGYAIAAFNCENMEMIQAILAAGQEMHAPVILQTTPTTLRYASAALFVANAKAAAEAVSIPVALHLDHGNSHALADEAVRAGYSSIMIDGSELSLAENIAFTKQTVDACTLLGIPVEGELGQVGGKEDDLEREGGGYTDPAEAVEFVAQTGVSSLAIGIGTAHGVYTTAPVLKPELVSALRDCVSVPLVLHGASGLGEDVVKDLITRGISKVNYATELRIAYTQAVRTFLAQNEGCIDPKKYGAHAREAVKQLVMSRIAICGCQGRA